MKNRINMMILVTLLAGLLSISACSAMPPSVDEIATRVAGTVNASSNAPIATPLPVEPPLPAPTTPPVQAETPQVPPVSVAFVGPDRNAYFWDETLQTARKLTESSDVLGAYVSPEGNFVALTRVSNVFDYSLDLIQSDGLNQRTLLSADAFNALPHPENTIGNAPSQVYWIPNSRKLAFSTRITFEGPGMANGDGLYILDTENRNLGKLLTVADTWAWSFSFSPDGEKIAISKPESLDIYHADGSLYSKALISFDFVNTASEYAWTPDPVWSPDSSSIGVAIPPQDPWTQEPADSTLAVLAIDGSSKQTYFSKLTYFPGGFAAFSPDLNHVAAITRQPTAPDNVFGLELMTLDPTQTTDYTTGKIYSTPLWSPDGSKFLYHDLNSGMYIGKTGVAPLAMPDIGEVFGMAWADNDRFFIATRSPESWKLILATVDMQSREIYSTSLTSDFPLMFTVNR